MHTERWAAFIILNNYLYFLFCYKVSKYNKVKNLVVDLNELTLANVVGQNRISIGSSAIKLKK